MAPLVMGNHLFSLWTNQLSSLKGLPTAGSIFLTNSMNSKLRFPLGIGRGPFALGRQRR